MPVASQKIKAIKDAVYVFTVNWSAPNVEVANTTWAELLLDPPRDLSDLQKILTEAIQLPMYIRDWMVDEVNQDSLLSKKEKKEKTKTIDDLFLPFWSFMFALAEVIEHVETASQGLRDGEVVPTAQKGSAIS